MKIRRWILSRLKRVKRVHPHILFTHSDDYSQWLFSYLPKEIIYNYRREYHFNHNIQPIQRSVWGYCSARCPQNACERRFQYGVFCTLESIIPCDYDGWCTVIESKIIPVRSKDIVLKWICQFMCVCISSYRTFSAALILFSMRRQSFPGHNRRLV